MGCCYSANAESYDSLKASLVTVDTQEDFSGELTPQTAKPSAGGTEPGNDITLTGIYSLPAKQSEKPTKQQEAQQEKNADFLSASLTVEDIGRFFSLHPPPPPSH
jgi:hypothetical protein